MVKIVELDAITNGVVKLAEPEMFCQVSNARQDAFDHDCKACCTGMKDLLLVAMKPKT